MIMREKIARALLAYDLPMKVGWNSIQEEVRQEYLDRADAALDALMKPTEGMIDATYEIDPYWSDGPDHKSVFIASIRAAKDGK